MAKKPTPKVTKSRKRTPPVQTVVPPPPEPQVLYTPSQQQLQAMERSAKTAVEVSNCLESCSHFVSNYVVIDDKSDGDKFKFDLWPSQRPILDLFVHERQVAVLKARQVGLTWLALAKSVWTGQLEKPGSTILLFSLRDGEAMELLARVKRIYSRLPKWLKCQSIVKDDAHELKLSNGTEWKAFPTGKGDSYTASMAIVDEFDLLEPQMQVQMMESIKPTVDGGGQLYLISKANKKVKWANSLFKSIYREAKTGQSRWKAAFLPWWARPDRSQDDYDAWKRESFNTTGSYDSVYGNYPESDAQALAPSSGDKRFPADWLDKCHRTQRPQTPEEIASSVPQLLHIRGLRVFKEPVYGRKYVGGGDPAEGTASSNPSALVLLDALTGEEVLSLNQKLTPAQTGQTMADISKVYNNATWLVERNNHGGTVIQWCQDHTTIRLLDGPDKRPGWPSNKKTKTDLFNWAAESIRDGRAIVHSFDLYSQLAMVESETLDSPITENNAHGDLATAYVLGLRGCEIDKSGEFTERDYQWDGANQSGHTPFGFREPTRRGGGDNFFGGGGSNHNPFGMR